MSDSNNPNVSGDSEAREIGPGSVEVFLDRHPGFCLFLFNLLFSRGRFNLTHQDYENYMLGSARSDAESPEEEFEEFEVPNLEDYDVGLAYYVERLYRIYVTMVVMLEICNYGSRR